MTCPQCFTIAPEGAAECPSCHTALQFSGLTAATGSFAVERAISRKISEAQSIKKMEESDKQLAEAFANQLTYIKPDEIEGLITQMQGNQEKDWESNLNTMIEEGIEKLNFEGMRLQDLISGDKNITHVLNTGLKFLRKAKYAEAVEWWTLQRGQPEVLPHSNTELLYLLMEMFTHRLANQLQRADQLIQQIRKHPAL